VETQIGNGETADCEIINLDVLEGKLQVKVSVGTAGSGDIGDTTCR